MTSRMLQLQAAVLAAATAAAAQPVPANPRQLTFPEEVFSLPAATEVRHELACGAVVYLREDHTLPLVDLTVALPVGTFLDPPAMAGLSSLTASLIRRAGAGELSADAFDERADFLGARLDSRGSDTRGGASLDTGAWVFEETLDLFLTMLRRPAFDPKRVRTTKTSLLESLQRRNEDPLQVLEREWQRLMVGADHYASRPITPATLAAIDRDALVSFHRRHWDPRRMVYAVSGDFDSGSVLAALSAAHDLWQHGSADAVRLPGPPTHVPLPGLYHLEFETPQAKVALGHRATAGGSPSERQRAALEVMVEVLGGSGAISRLGGRLRTAEGLAYRTSAYFDAAGPLPGDFRVFFDTDNHNVARAVSLVLEEIDRLRSRKIHPKELEVVQQTLLSTLRLRFDTAEKIAGYYAEDELLGRGHEHWAESYRLVSEITADEVLTAAREFIVPERLVILVVGRAAEIGLSVDAPGELEQLTGLSAVRLPARDPLTLEPAPRGADEP